MSLTLNSSMNRLAVRGLREEPHGCTMDLFKVVTLEEEVGTFKAQLQQGDYLWD